MNVENRKLFRNKDARSRLARHGWDYGHRPLNSWVQCRSFKKAVTRGNFYIPCASILALLMATCSYSLTACGVTTS